MDRDCFICLFKHIGLNIETKEIQIILKFYNSFIQFICTYPMKTNLYDYDIIIYILTRYELYAQNNPQSAGPIYRAMIDTVRLCREKSHSHWQVKEYLTLLEKYYIQLATVEPQSALNCYSNLIEIFLELSLENFPEFLTKIVTIYLNYQPVLLLELLIRYRCNYKPLIDEINQRLLNPNDKLLMCQQLPQVQLNYINYIVSSYVKQVERCFAVSKGEISIIECWTKCIYFILEFSSEYDDYIASCYMKLNDSIKAAMVFDSTIYQQFAIKYCSNACRRYLKYVYPQSQMREELERIFVNHFDFVNDERKIRPLEPVKY